MGARLAQVQFPYHRVLLARTRLAYVHLQNLLSDAKRDRGARVFGYVAVWLPDELVLLYLQEGELIAATATRDGLQYAPLAVRDALRRVPTAAEYGEICFHEADDEQLACMYAAQVSPAVAWPSEVRTHDANAVLAHLLASMFDGVVEVVVDGTVSYVTFRHGLPRQVFARLPAHWITLSEQVRALWPSGATVQVRRWAVPAPVPVQPSPALVDLYRSVMRGLTEQLSGVGVRDAAELVERSRAGLLSQHAWLERFGSATEVVRDPITTADAMTKGITAWISDVLWAAALPDAVTPEQVLRELTRERRHALQSAGFFEALPWKVQ
jgi:hypothetical protein